MQLRAARMMDVFDLVEILVERHCDTRYADLVKIDEPLARKKIGYSIQRHGGTNEGGTFVYVATDEDDKPAAFIVGSLGRIYGFGEKDKLASDDDLLIGRKGCSPFVLDQLFERYVKWATDNPKVIEVGASWANTINGANRFAVSFERRGFSKVGETWSRLTASTQAKGVAA